MIIRCDKCRKTMLIQHEGLITDMLRGWKFFHDIGTLCPECSKEFKDIVSKFMGREVYKEGDDDDCSN